MLDWQNRKVLATKTLKNLFQNKRLFNTNEVGWIQVVILQTITPCSDVVGYRRFEGS